MAHSSVRTSSRTMRSKKSRRKSSRQASPQFLRPPTLIIDLISDSEDDEDEDEEDDENEYENDEDYSSTATDVAPTNFSRREPRSLIPPRSVIVDLTEDEDHTQLPTRRGFIHSSPGPTSTSASFRSVQSSPGPNPIQRFEVLIRSTPDPIVISEDEDEVELVRETQVNRMSISLSVSPSPNTGEPQTSDGNRPLSPVVGQIESLGAKQMDARHSSADSESSLDFAIEESDATSLAIEEFAANWQTQDEEAAPVSPYPDWLQKLFETRLAAAKSVGSHVFFSWQFYEQACDPHLEPQLGENGGHYHQSKDGKWHVYCHGWRSPSTAELIVQFLVARCPEARHFLEPCESSSAKVFELLHVHFEAISWWTAHHSANAKQPRKYKDTFKRMLKHAESNSTNRRGHKPPVRRGRLKERRAEVYNPYDKKKRRKK